MTNKNWTQFLALALFASFAITAPAKALTPEQLCAGLTNADVCIAALTAQQGQESSQSQAEKEKAAKEKAAKEKAAAEKAQKEAEELAKQQEESDNFVAPGTKETTLGYNTVVNIEDYKGQTFFVTMQKQIKPKLDDYAQYGFQVVSGNTALQRLKKVDKKVYNKAIRAAGSEANVKKIADELTKDSSVTFYDLPQAIMQVGIGGGAYDLSTIFALLSGGGVAVRIEDGSYAYNVNYGTGDKPKDEMTGRSFGEAPGRMALDASDAHYLTILEKYVRGAGENSRHFYHALLKILMNSDPDDFSQISNEGKAVAADFVAVYVAEQDRHLMADLQSHHWDVALLEVTLLSALHGGQSEVAVMYRDKLTSRTLKQQNGCATTQPPEQKASMVDYWQFSTNTDPSGCNRSGINPTKRDFRKLGRLITQFERNKNPQLVKKIENNMSTIQKSGNVFADLSNYLISFQAPRNMSAKQMELAEDFAEFLMQVRADADEITASIKAAQ